MNGSPWTYPWIFGVTLAMFGSEAVFAEQLPDKSRVVGMVALPPHITLKTPYDYAQVLVTAQLDSGEHMDVTRLAQVEKPAAIVRLSPTGLVVPVADGSGQLKFTVGGQSVMVPVKVSGQKDAFKVSFVRDVMPIMSKVGCNAGTCHGAAKGKNGFKLSLRGYDPVFDHRALTDDIQGRRFNRSAPDLSLMLLKPSGGAPHGGGVHFQPGDRYYNVLRDWIADGVQLDLKVPRVARIEVFPKNPMVPRIGMKQQMVVLAHYSDSSIRDVSAEAFIESSNIEVATVDKQGIVATIRRGEAAMLARYEGNYDATTMVVMGDRSGYQWHEVPEYNYIDSLVDEKLRAVKVLPSGLCTDLEFIRRVYLDLTGLPPEPEDVRAFLADKRASKVKREALVDKLVGSKEFIEYWTNKWADMLQVNRKFLGENGARSFRNWIRDAVAANMPYDKFAFKVLTASGSTLDNPPASYYKILRDPESVMENTTQLFLAIRFNCNKCHDHPFERWTQDQYYELAAFFARVGRTEDLRFKGQKIGGTDVTGATPLVEMISDQAGGEVRHERTGVLTGPKFPFLHKDLAPATQSRREQLTHWIASKDNPYFAKSYVNRVWSYLLGVGLIEPVDDIRAGNPPSNPKLLDALAQDFIAHDFDVQHMIRTICKSRVYQQAIATNRWNEGDDINFAHGLVRRLPAEVLFDSIHRVTGAQSHLTGIPAGVRAAETLDSKVEESSGFLDLFGRPQRESSCECERSSGMMLGPILNLVNGPVVADALKDPGNRINKLLLREKDDRKVVEEMFLAILCRCPTDKEMALGLHNLGSNKEEFQEIVAEHQRRVDALAVYEKQLPARQAEWEKVQIPMVNWKVLEPITLSARSGAVFAKQPDGSVLVSGTNAPRDQYVLTVQTPLAGITGIRLEVVPDPRLPAQGPGRAPNGNFVLNEFHLVAIPLADPRNAAKVELHNASATFSQASFLVGQAIDSNPRTGWAIAPMFGRPQTALFELKKPVGTAGGTLLTFILDQRYGGNHTIGRFRLSLTTDKPPIRLSTLPDAVSSILAVPMAKRTPHQQAALTQYFRSLDPNLARLQRAVAEHYLPVDSRALGAQDLAWALINSQAFLFNH